MTDHERRYRDALTAYIVATDYTGPERAELDAAEAALAAAIGGSAAADAIARAHADARAPQTIENPADAAPYVTFPADDPKYTRGTHVQWHATAQAMRDYANAGTLTGRDYRVCLYLADSYERTSEQHLSADAIRQETSDDERQMIAAAIAHATARA